MSSRAAKLTPAALTDADPMTAEEYYPRHLVVSGVLTFCLTIWALVILAVAHYV